MISWITLLAEAMAVGKIQTDTATPNKRNLITKVAPQ